MPQTNPQDAEQKKYAFRIKYGPALGLSLLNGINSVLNFLSLKASKRFWGVVYDSVSKQPLDPAIVKLLYVDGREIQTCVTDMAGRYGFLAGRGKFKIHARKSNYKFPSDYVRGSKDGVYENLYHGEFFVLAGDSEVLAPNIPMDPVNSDWNQIEKQRLGSTHFYSKVFLKRFVAVLFWFGLVFCLLYGFSQLPKISLSVLSAVILYAILIILAKILPEGRLWGQIEVKAQIENSSGLFLELNNAQYSNVNFGKTYVNEDGKFLLRANPGKYLLIISNVDLKGNRIPLGSLPLKIGRNGVLSSSVVINMLQ